MFPVQAVSRVEFARSAELQQTDAVPEVFHGFRTFGDINIQATSVVGLWYVDPPDLLEAFEFFNALAERAVTWDVHIDFEKDELTLVIHAYLPGQEHIPLVFPIPRPALVNLANVIAQTGALLISIHAVALGREHHLSAVHIAPEALHIHWTLGAAREVQLAGWRN